MRSFCVIALLAMFLSGCTVRHGQWLETYRPATEPAGVQAALRVGAGEQLEGELLALEEGGLLVLAGNVIYRVPWAGVLRARFPEASTELAFRGPEAPRPAVREELRLLSRFPQGVGDDLMRRLLRAHGQAEVVEIGAARVGASSAAHPAAHSGPGFAAGAAGAAADSLAAFVAIVREATARFHDRGVAIREGYRKLGPDFPAMGEHWIHPGLVIDGEVDPARPPVLSYASLEGHVTLTGVAYTLPLDGGEDPPPFLGRRDVWHDHSSRVDEESLLLNHRHPDPVAGPPRGPRLTMVHVWAWTGNPDGMLAQHNRSLPFLRVGLPVAPDAPVEAWRALSLAGEGTAYYLALLEAAVRGAEDATRFRGTLERHGARVDAWVTEVRGEAGGRATTTPDVAPLVAIWDSLWAELEDVCRPEARARLDELRGALEG